MRTTDVTGLTTLERPRRVTSLGSLTCRVHPLFRGLFAWVIGRVGVVNSERPRSGDLHHGLFRGPGIMVHTCWHFGKSSGFEGLPLFHVELVAEADTEVTGDHRHELVSGMLMGRYLVVGRHL